MAKQIMKVKQIIDDGTSSIGEGSGIT